MPRREKAQASKGAAAKGAPRLALILATLMVGAVVVAASYVYISGSGDEHQAYVPGSEPADDRPHEGNAPDFTLVDTVGGTFSLSQNRGKVIVIDFMAIWYQPCAEELMHLNEVYDQFVDKGLLIVSVDVDLNEKLSDLHEYKLRNTAPWQFCLDTAGAGSFPEYNATSIPTLVIVDRDGNIAARHVGVTNSAVLAAEIAPLI